ncbi:hypothetical protein A6770_16635 [Nostoc minutum NIES-26]|uniref:Uncharacterized protein n=1 Tax=Nostoc minutum NIES-26 TaxID=1844469 RepID=A0A367RI66_9NOSO|nr:hypothetical protein A6770_16635 [Nostoc minutum NIES-26]
MPNPKGTPENLRPIKSNREEPLTDRINLRITKAMKEKLSAKDDPPEFCRRAIQKALDEDSNE